MTRRGLLATCAAATLPTQVFGVTSQVRLGVLQFGSVQWVADVIRRHALDHANGFELATIMLANTDGGRVSLMANAADVIVSDWFFVASQRAAGTRLSFAPFSSTSGGIMVPEHSPIRSLDDLAGHRLGVAGGPLDKSWLIVKAAAQLADRIDLATSAELTYGAPPLLNAMLQRNEMDAVLTYWNFAARLDGAGFRQVISVDECARMLGLSGRLTLIGYVFHEDWARQNVAAINGLLAASAAAEAIIASSDAEWEALRPLTGATDDALSHSLRRRFVDGIQQAAAETQQRDAMRLFEIVRRAGGKRVTGGLDALPEGVFWQVPNG